MNWIVSGKEVHPTCETICPFILLTDINKVSSLIETMLKCSKYSGKYEYQEKFDKPFVREPHTFSLLRGNKQGKARICMVSHGESRRIDNCPYMFVTNIIPIDGSRIPICLEEYNQIAKNFYEELMKPSANSLRLTHGEQLGGKEITTYKTQKTLEEKESDIQSCINLYNKDQERPHLVILGAGASRACLSPKGEDANGKKIPLMNDIVDYLKLKPTIRKHGVQEGDMNNFEDFYSSIYLNYPQLAKEIEQKVREYFSDLRLPACPTIYDYLTLCLREKDVIATFNWDPLLFQAANRSYNYLRHEHNRKVPNIIYLHGNTEIGYCCQCKRCGSISSHCGGCGNRYKKSKLIYPVKTKNYSLGGVPK